MNTRSQLFTHAQSAALELLKSNLDSVNKLTKGALGESSFAHIVDLSLRGLRVARPPRAPAFGLGLNGGLDPAYIVRDGRVVFEAVYETLAPIGPSFVENLDRQTCARALRWRIEAGAALIHPTRALSVIVWDPEREHPPCLVSIEEQQGLRRPIELLIERTMRGAR